MLLFPSTLLQITTNASPGWVPWAVAGGIVVLGLILYGWRDLLRLNLRRTWAISDVCFAEAIRKRILWVTPLAIIGVIVVCQLSAASDPQEAIRQATRFCLFASGLLVTVVAVILACTNLPREIDSRVIYTVVTKPTTRLEIVAGKVLGFARIAGAILIVMGVFTYAYLQYRTWSAVQQVRHQLAALPADAPTRPTLAYYADAGFLATKSLAPADDLQILGRPPEGNVRWMQGGMMEYFVVPFELTDDQKAELDQASRAGAVFLTTTLQIEQHAPNEEEQRVIKEMGLDRPQGPTTAPSRILGPAFPTTLPTTRSADQPPPVQVQIRILSAGGGALTGGSDVGAGTIMPLEKPSKPGESWYGHLELKPELVAQMLAQPHRFYVQVNGRSPATSYGVDLNAAPVMLFIPTSTGGIKIPPAPDPDQPGKPTVPRFRSYPARRGMRLEGVAGGKGPVAVFDFQNAHVGRPDNGKVALQLQLNIEKSSEYTMDVGGSAYARVAVEAINRKTGQSGGVRYVTPEVSRTIYMDIPYSAVEGGNFEVLLRGMTQGQWLGVREDSVSLVTADRSFIGNLAKSLLLLWMLAILVVVIAVFCSTFLSWPIAVVCTLLILLGHWGVEQLGDAISPGVGHRTISEFGLNNPTIGGATAEAVEKLSTGLRFISQFLPDVSRFPVTEDIERGVSIPPASMFSALSVLLCYGLPLVVFSYVILRKKEVAP